MAVERLEVEAWGRKAEQPWRLAHPRGILRSFLALLLGAAAAVAPAASSPAATLVRQVTELAVGAVAAAVLQVETAPAALPRCMERRAN
mmetsp:Transcript_9411/g.14949  ORF Transcript_9411/g.14949 Transcript_9411/m.14949 type:complete len:89 (+) Transcript_9411:464-730(+)